MFFIHNYAKVYKHRILNFYRAIVFKLVYFHYGTIQNVLVSQK